MARAERRFRSCALCLLHVERAPHASRAVLQDVRVDHRRRDIAVTEELLYGTDVMTALQQVGGEGMAKGVASNAFVDCGRRRRLGHRALEDAVELMMTSFAALRVLPPAPCR